MSEYTSYDFEETLAQAEGFSRSDVASALGAWGRNGDYAEWDGGFLLALKDGRFAYVSGWCDTTGWGCQDGVETAIYDTLPVMADLADEDWEENPIDLNRFLSGDIKEFDKE